MSLVSLVEFLVQYAFFLLSASVHESSHAWTAYKFGDPTAKLQNRVSLNPANHIDILGTVIIPFMVFLSNVPIIGWARPTPVNPSNFQNPRRDGMFVSGAGPVSNLLCAAFLAILWHLMFSLRAAIGPTAQLFCYVFATGILVNLMLAVFNLMPIHPLDGSGVVGGLLPQEWAEAYDRMRPYGFIVLLILFYLPGFRQIIWSIVSILFSIVGIQWFPLEEIW
ncbi:MAG TPA: site-2 protease family protein [Acidobacteriota bacterium]